MLGQLFIFWLFLFFVIALIGLFEMNLSSNFNLFYFRTGIPIYRKRFSFYGTLPEILSVQILEQNFTDYGFKLFNSDECAFRKTIRVKKSGVMHGIIRLSRERGYIIITGYADWLPLLFIFWLVGFFLILGSSGGGGGDWSGIFFSPYFLVLYLIFGISFLSDINTFTLVGMRITGRL